MEKIDIICVGTLKESALRELAREYEKRLSRFCRLKITELDEARLPRDPRQADVERALEKEGEAMISAAPAGAYAVALCVEGKRQSSENFAALLENAALRRGGTAFFIGSSYGLSKKVKDFCDLRLSLSDMTFPHQLFRVILLEQLYRAHKIRAGETYHK